MPIERWTSLIRHRQSHPNRLIIPSVSLLLLTLHAYYFWYSPSILSFKVTAIPYRATKGIMPCRIPETLIFPKALHNWDPKKGYKNCSYAQKLFQLSDEGQLKLMDSFREKNMNKQPCCLQHILRGSKDSVYEVTKCNPVADETDMRKEEVFLVRCKEHLNVDAHIPDKVTDTVNYWRKAITHPDDAPYSVFIFGHDTNSRANAYRSVPRALELMKKMKFVDFSSLHSLWPSTLGNFMAMLMGLERWRVKEVCNQGWETPYDDCPFIWKNFSAKEYVTGYLEDGIGATWNWGGQAGFRKSPTDYYIHHLFRTLKKIRVDQGKALGNQQRLDCVSDESVSAFQFRYSRRFLRKFQHVPFFFMTWFNDPFHGNPEYLANTEDEMLKFVSFLESQPKLLRKTLMIYVGDHGDRFGFYYGKSVESFFERGNPPLFVRLPDQMVEEFPEFAENLETNSKNLVTHFDIYHTLLHILHLANVTSSFHPVLKDRSSLLVEVPTNRTCASTHIPEMFCLCNLQYSPTGANTWKLEKESGRHVIGVILNHFNHLLNQYPHGHLCRKWTLNNRTNIIYARSIGIFTEYNEVLVAFESAVGAKFEARIRLKNGLNKMYRSRESAGYGKVVEVSRTNSYKNHSGCLPTRTEEDKKMKNFCICKSYFRITTKKGHLITFI